MSDHPTILRRPASTAGSRPSRLPPDLLAKGRRRLRGILLLFGALSLLTVLLNLFLLGGLMSWATRAFHVVHTATAFALAGLVSWRRVSDAAALDLGLVYEILLCWAVPVIVLPEVYAEVGIVPHVTWSSLIILAFPLIVPFPPGRMLAAALASAAATPVTVLFLLPGGPPEPVVDNVIGLSISPAFCVVIAYVGARFIHALGLDVARSRQLGAYTLEREIGRGGMGSVWLASHRMLARPAAIKLIRPKLLGAESPAGAEALIGRFEREAKTTSRLTSPHTVEVYDFGRTDDGAFYYVMELLAGLDLATLVRRHGPVPAARAVGFLRQACLSLADAHAHGLVHRDIKPANLFLCRQGVEYDFVKLLDFGLVRPATGRRG